MPQFIPIDTDRWSRKSYYDHFMSTVRCTFSMTVDLDITQLRSTCKDKGIKLYPALIYAIAAVVNQHQCFRMDIDADGNLGYWESLSPCYTVFNPQNEQFSNLSVPYSDSFAPFYSSYLANLQAYGQCEELWPQPDIPYSTFSVSAIPWAKFTAFNLNIYAEGEYLLPIFTMGKYAQQPDGSVLLPLALQVHHAVCDGYHASKLTNDLQQQLYRCDEWLQG